MSWWRRRGPVRYTVMDHRCDHWKVPIGAFIGFTLFGYAFWWVINKAMGR